VEEFCPIANRYRDFIPFINCSAISASALSQKRILFHFSGDLTLVNVVIAEDFVWCSKIFEIHPRDTSLEV